MVGGISAIADPGESFGDLIEAVTSFLYWPYVAFGHFQRHNALQPISLANIETHHGSLRFLPFEFLVIVRQEGDAHSDGRSRCCRKNNHPLQAQAW